MQLKDDIADLQFVISIEHSKLEFGENLMKI